MCGEMSEEDHYVKIYTECYGRVWLIANHTLPVLGFSFPYSSNKVIYVGTDYFDYMREGD